MYKIDLHTHSNTSPDGAILARHYRQALERGKLDYIAITDHDTISFAQRLHREIGEQIIVGEEITTSQGEIIGLYLDKAVPAGMSAAKTVKAIHGQGGIVYVPHPFERVRKGVSETVLNEIADEVDVIEVHNGRAIFQNKGRLAQAWSAQRGMPSASSSDAHGYRGWGRAYSLIADKPTAEKLPALLKDADYIIGTVGMLGVLYPKFNRLRKKVRHV
jgi:predicted metal-dependent phosphoesterase TrpH